MGFGFRFSGVGFRVSDFEFEVSGFEFRVSGFGFGVRGPGFENLTGPDATARLEGVNPKPKPAKLNLIVASIYDKYSVSPSIRPMYTRCF